jgi:phosphoesterase RecJ-like protein
MQKTSIADSRNWSEDLCGHLLRGHEGIVDDIYQALKNADSVLIGTHEHPDGDAVGSSLSLYNALRLQGKKVTVYIPDAAPDIYSFVPGFNDLTTRKPNPHDYDVVVLLDYTKLYRTHLENDVQQHKCTICIDHHHGNVGEAKFNLVVPEAAATAHILMALFERTGTPITKDMATCLLTGIFTDTGSFMHDSTTPDILKVAAALMSKGARLSHIAHETYQKKELPGLRIWGRALSRIVTNYETGVVTSIITKRDLQECGAELDDLSGVVNMMNTLPDTKFAMLLCEYQPGKIKGSLRSEPHKGVDVSAVARKLGGGGHKLAAGFEVEGRLVKQDNTWRVLPA